MTHTIPSATDDQLAPNGSAELRLSDYQFELPPELIAQEPASDRDGARLLVVDRRSGERVHARVRDLPQFLQAGDLLVANDTRVIEARVRGEGPAGGFVELLLVRPLSSPATWLCLGKPSRRLRVGARLRLAGGVAALVEERRGDGSVEVRLPVDLDVTGWLARHGELPLPPYIRRPAGPTATDRERYQTIFAARPGAVAAPTAGLHFTSELLAALGKRGVPSARVTLHVGPGTFQPVRTEDMRQHPMAPEWAEVPEDTVRRIEATRQQGGRVVAIGTTTTRALESAAASGRLEAGPRWADRFLVPGVPIYVVDALFTNFHLPGSTLLLLVAAFLGPEAWREAYEEAVRHRYRFYSYGDAMLIL